jgi:hypothetical protein
MDSRALANVGLIVVAVGICWFTGAQSASTESMSPVLFISLMATFAGAGTSEDESSNETDETYAALRNEGSIKNSLRKVDYTSGSGGCGQS